MKCNISLPFVRGGLGWGRSTSPNPSLQRRGVSLLVSLLVVLAMTVQAAEQTPRELEGVGVEEHMGAKLDLTRTFVDEKGSIVALQDFLKEGKPVILSLVYYGCPNLCSFLLNGLTDSLKELNWTVGEQFDIVHVSIDPTEDAELAMAKRESHLKAYGRNVKEGAWHFLTGKEANIQALAKEVGFQYRYDKEQEQYAHAAVLIVLMPDGKISRYLYGIRFDPKDLKLALLEASHGKVGNIVEKFLLFCYHYDPQTKKYALFATRLMKGAGVITVAGIGLLFFTLRRKGKNA